MFGTLPLSTLLSLADRTGVLAGLIAHAAPVASGAAAARPTEGVAAARDRVNDLASGLKLALAAPDQLSLAYQPRIDPRSGECLSVEALLRWTHPRHGAVSPAEFIPIAEKTGLMRLVTDWVIEHALVDLQSWSELGFQHGVSINVSGSNLAEDDFVERLGQAMAGRGVDPARVELEITEDLLVRDDAGLRERLARLVEAGVRLSIDDFGVGYSNLAYLRELPASTLKIDRSFVRDLAARSRDQIIVRSVISLAHALDYRVVAEGVEDAEALALLAGWGCDEAQGYHISRPVPLAALQSWLAARLAPSPALRGRGLG